MLCTCKFHRVRVLLAAALIVILFSGGQSLGESRKNGMGSYGGKRFTAVVHYIADGDSFVVNNNGVQISIRLWGVDAPEFDQPHSKASKKGLEQLLSGNDIEIVPKYVDRFGRLVAIVEAGDIVVNSALIGRGNAWVHPYYCTEAACDQWYQLQEETRRLKRGLWADVDPIEPWVWKMKK